MISPPVMIWPTLTDLLGSKSHYLSKFKAGTSALYYQKLPFRDENRIGLFSNSFKRSLNTIKNLF